MTDESQPLINHLLELRTRLLKIICCVALVLVALLYFANDIYQLISAPLISRLPAGSSMIATDVTAPFFTPIKLTAMVAILLSIPYILYQIWAFVAPALYRHERRLVMPFIISSTVLFYLVMAFAFFAVFPLAFCFFIHSAAFHVPCRPLV